MTQWYFRADWWIAIFTSALFMATTGLWVFTALMWRATSRAVADSRVSSEREYRAYIDAFGIAVGVDEPFKPLIQLRICNIGKSIASQVRIFGEIDLLPYPLSNFSRIDSLNRTNQPTTSLWPHHPSDAPLRPPIGRVFNADEIESMIDACTLRLYAFGRVEYVDIFGKSRQTPFFFSVSGGPSVRNALNGHTNPPERMPRFEFVSLDREPT